MAGIKREELPPETPFMKANGAASASATPMMPKFALGRGFDAAAAARDPNNRPR